MLLASIRNLSRELSNVTQIVSVKFTVPSRLSNGILPCRLEQSGRCTPGRQSHTRLQVIDRDLNILESATMQPLAHRPITVLRADSFNQSEFEILKNQLVFDKPTIGRY